MRKRADVNQKPALSPENSVWLAILNSRTDLLRMEPIQVRQALAEGGFPPELVEDYLANRRTNAAADLK